MSAYLHFGHALPVKTRAHSLHFQSLGFWTVIGAMALGTALLLRIPSATTKPVQAVTPSIADSRTALQAQISQISQESGFVTVTGEASNVSKSTLNNVEAVAMLYDNRKRLVRVESALIEFPQLAPGERSPFRVQMQGVDQFAECEIRFRTLMGAGIPASVLSGERRK